MTTFEGKPTPREAEVNAKTLAKMASAAKTVGVADGTKRLFDLVQGVLAAAKR